MVDPDTPALSGSTLEWAFEPLPMPGSENAGLALPIDQLAPIHKTGSVYHYTDTKTVCEILRSGTMWAGNMKQLNDSEEILFGFKKIREFLFSDSLHADTTEREKLVQLVEIASNLVDDDKVFILCASAEGDLLSQYRAYGEWQIEIDCSRPIYWFENRWDFQPALLYSTALPGWRDVVYVDNEVEHLVVSYLDQILQVMREVHDRGRIWNPASNELYTQITSRWLLIAASLIKYPSFVDERERRFLVVNENIALRPIVVSSRKNPGEYDSYAPISGLEVDSHNQSLLKAPVGIRSLKLIPGEFVNEDHANLAFSAVMECVSEYASEVAVAKSDIPYRFGSRTFTPPDKR